MNHDPHQAPDYSSHGATLARGAFINTLAFLASNLRGIFTFLVARLLGSAILGIFGLAWAAMDLVSKFCTLGFDYSAIAFIAKAEGAGHRESSRRVRTTAVAISFSSSVLIALAGFFVVWRFGAAAGIRPEFVQPSAVMLLALPGVTLYRVNTALSRGMTVMHHDIFSRGLTESLGTAIALLAAFALGARELAPELAAIAGTLASGLVAFFLARRLFTATEPVRPSPDDDLVPSLLRASGPIALYDLLNIGIMRIDFIMLGWFVGRAPGVTLETLGIYAAAVELSCGLRKVSQSFTPIFTPIVARQMGTGQIRDAEASYGYLARWMLAILLPAVAGLGLAGGALMMIFGPTFYRGGVWTAVIGLGCALNAFAGLGEVDPYGGAAQYQPDKLDDRLRGRDWVEPPFDPCLWCTRSCARRALSLCDQRPPALDRDPLLLRMALAVASAPQAVDRGLHSPPLRSACPLHEPLVVAGSRRGRALSCRVLHHLAHHRTGPERSRGS